MARSNIPHHLASQLLCWSLLPVFFGSCGLYHYMPNSHNVPLFHQKGEVRAVVAKSTVGTPQPQHLLTAIPSVIFDQQPGFEFQGAYALKDHLGVMANGFLVHDRTGTESKARYFEAGAGWFKAMDPHVVLEAYGGFGFGGIRQDAGNGACNSIQLMRGFLQPAMGYSSRNFDLAFSLRLSTVAYHGYTGPDSKDPTWDGEMAALSGQDPRVIVEPALTLRFGPRSAKMQLQWGWARNQGERLSMVDQTFSVGLQLNINNVFKRN